MKIAIIALILITITGCSWKKNEANGSGNQESNVLVLSTPDDIDGDLLSQAEEISLGTNPESANIPEIRIYNVPSVVFSLRIQKNNEIKNLKIESLFNISDINNEKLVKSKKDRISSRISMLHLRELQDEVLSKSDLLEPFEDNISIIPIKNKAYLQWQDYKEDGWSIKDGFIYLEMQLEISDLLGVTKIDKVSYSLGIISDDSRFDQLYFYPELYNLNTTPAIFENFGNIENFKDSRIFKTSLNGLEGSKIESILSKRTSLAMMINDFSIRRYSKLYSYKSTKDTIVSKNAYVIVKINDSYDRIITPYKKSLEEILSQKYQDIRYDSSYNILSVDNYSSTMIFPINIDILTTQSLDNGNWRIIAPEKTIKSIPLTKTVTIVSYSSVEDFLINLKRDNKDTAQIFSNKRIVENSLLNPKDVVHLKIEEKVNHPFSVGQSIGFSYEGGPPECVDPFLPESTLGHIGRGGEGGVDRPRTRCMNQQSRTIHCSYNFNIVEHRIIQTGERLSINKLYVLVNNDRIPLLDYLEDPSDIYIDRQNNVNFILDIQPKMFDENSFKLLYMKDDTWIQNGIGYTGGCDGRFRPEHRQAISSDRAEYLFSAYFKKLKSNYREN